LIVGMIIIMRRVRIIIMICCIKPENKGKQTLFHIKVSGLCLGRGEDGYVVNRT